jgi:hypothetical protein
VACSAASGSSGGSGGSDSTPAHRVTMQDSTITLTEEERALFDTLLAAARFAGSGTVLRAAGGWVRDKLLGRDSSDIDIALDNMLGRDFALKVVVAVLCGWRCAQLLACGRARAVAAVVLRASARTATHTHSVPLCGGRCCLPCDSTRTLHVTDPPTHTTHTHATTNAQVNEYLASQGKETRTAAVIQSNPEQSKHLETARMKVNALWIDLVNLRSESYADGSRIPTMQFGSPAQDAERRCVCVCACACTCACV